MTMTEQHALHHIHRTHDILDTERTRTTAELLALAHAVFESEEGDVDTDAMGPPDEPIDEEAYDLFDGDDQPGTGPDRGDD